jgi:hypothetical protein
MRDQLYHLAEVAEHPRTSIQVIRYGGAHAGLLAHFVIADLEGRPCTVYLETAAEGVVTDSLPRRQLAGFHQPAEGPGLVAAAAASS